MKRIAALDSVGNALILQLAFVLFAVPLLTAAPAAIALQRSLAALRRGERTGLRSFAGEFSAAARSLWPLGALLALNGFWFFVGITFWASVTSLPGTVGLVVLVGLLGLAIGTWLSLLAVVVDETSWRSQSLIRQGFGHLAQHPLRGLLGVVTMLAWGVLAISFPSLLLVGSGLVPALISKYVLTPRAHTR